MVIRGVGGVRARLSLVISLWFRLRLFSFELLEVFEVREKEGEWGRWWPLGREKVCGRGPLLRSEAKRAEERSDELEYYSSAEVPETDDDISQVCRSQRRRRSLVAHSSPGDFLVMGRLAV